MPSFDFDVSEYAVNYIRECIKDLPGNAGQEVLVQDLEIDCVCIITVEIAGRSATEEISGSINFRSNHPDAIEQIIEKAEDHFEEFIYYLENLNEAPNSFLVQIMFDAITEAFSLL
jgi:hypothetical protein